MATATKKPAAKKAAPAKAAAGGAVAVRKPSGGAVSLNTIKEQLQAQAAAMAGRIAPAGGNTIRVGNDKKLTLPDGTKTEELECVVVDFTSYNTFYEGTYDSKNPVPPTCFAIHPIPKEMAPSDNSPAKQNDDCATCPMNAFGSNGNGKACKNQRRLAILPPDADEDTPLWLLNVSPTAIRNFDGFVAGISRTYQMPPIAVTVKISCDQNSEFQKLVFNDPQPNEQLAEHFARLEEAKALLAEEPDVSSYDQAKAAAPARGKAPARRQAARR